MTHLLILPIAFFAAPFWETKDPSQWTEAEAKQILTDSPWARQAGVPIYLASARPAIDAEARLAEPPTTTPGEIQRAAETDYRDYLKENPGKHIILAVQVPRPEEFRLTEEWRKMEQECVMKAGRKEYKIVGHFPPTRSDPYLRLLFPRVLDPVDNTLSFSLFLPSVPKPYRTVVFFLKEMKYKGRLEY